MQSRTPRSKSKPLTPRNQSALRPPTSKTPAVNFNAAFLLPMINRLKNNMNTKNENTKQQPNRRGTFTLTTRNTEPSDYNPDDDDDVCMLKPRRKKNNEKSIQNMEILLFP